MRLQVEEGRVAGGERDVAGGERGVAGGERGVAGGERGVAGGEREGFSDLHEHTKDHKPNDQQTYNSSDAPQWKCHTEKCFLQKAPNFFQN